MTTAAQAFYDFARDNQEQMAHGQGFPGLLVYSMLKNLNRLADSTLKLSRQEHTKAMRSLRGDYRHSFDFVCKQLLEVMQDKAAYSQAVDCWPLMDKLLSLPAFGWKFYKHVLNECYGSGALLANEGVHYTFMFDFAVEGSMDLVFWTSAKGGYYMERIPVSLPETPAKTWGAELRALAKLLKKVGKDFKIAYARTRTYSECYTGPRNMLTERSPRAAYKSALVRPASYDSPRAQEARQLKQLLGQMKKSYTPAEKALLRKHPQKVSGALGLSM